MPYVPEKERDWRACLSLLLSIVMALCLRKLEGKRDWDDPRKEEPWLAANDLRADALKDLVTQENKLSVYRVTEVVPVQRILAALGSARDNLVKIDFILFDFDVLKGLAIAYEEVLGTTLDSEVNACHIDLIELTGKKIADFGAKIRAAPGGESSRQGGQSAHSGFRK
jgi:hypothetical protein